MYIYVFFPIIPVCFHTFAATDPLFSKKERSDVESCYKEQMKVDVTPVKWGPVPVI